MNSISVNVFLFSLDFIFDFFFQFFFASSEEPNYFPSSLCIFSIIFFQSLHLLNFQNSFVSLIFPFFFKYIFNGIFYSFPILFLLTPLSRRRESLTHATCRLLTMLIRLFPHCLTPYELLLLEKHFLLTLNLLE